MIIKYTKNNRTLFKIRNEYLGIDVRTNKEIRINKSNFRTKKDAEIYLSKIRLEIEQNNGIYNSDKITFHDVFELWFNSYQHTIKSSTLHTFKGYKKTYYDRLKNIPIKKLDLIYFQNYFNELANTYKVGTLKLIKMHISMVLDYAVKVEIINKNPLKYVQLPKKTIKIDDKELYYNKEELQTFFQLVENTDNIKVFAMFRVLAFTGIRQGELLALTWEDIDLENLTIDINKTIAVTGQGVQIQTPKSNRSIRKISIDMKTASILKKWKLKQKEDFFKLGVRVKKEKQLCFSNKKNTFIYIQFLRDKMKQLCKDNNFKRIKIHGFRHTHCSLLFEAGLTIQEVQSRLGHSDIQTTMQIYAHVTDRQKEKVAEKFQNYVNF